MPPSGQFDYTPYVLQLLQQDTDEAVHDEDERMQLALVVMAMQIGAEEDKQARIEVRAGKRHGLRREDLQPDPRGETGWTRLYNRRNDRAWITTMGFGVVAFETLLEKFKEVWYLHPIPRADTSSTGISRPSRRSLLPSGALGLALHWLNSTMHEVTLQELFALTPTTVSRYIHFSLIILLRTLRTMPEGAIVWPSTLEELQYLSSLVEARHSLLRGAFGSVDGLNLPLQTSSDLEMENAAFNSWLHSHLCSNVFVYAPTGSLASLNNVNVTN
jgi:hypothetical protein